MLIVIRMIILFFFLIWRIENPNYDALWLWGLSIICELWFAFSWLLDILPKFNPINRSADLTALKEKFEMVTPSNPTGRSDLPGLDVFISTADPEKEPPLVTANTILSILAVEYPVEKMSVYISDDGGAILNFEAMAEAVKFGEVIKCNLLCYNFYMEIKVNVEHIYIRNSYGFHSVGSTISSQEILTATSARSPIQRKARNAPILSRTGGGSRGNMMSSR